MRVEAVAQSQVKPGFYGWRNVVILFLNYGLLYGVAFYGYSISFPAMIKALGWARGDASVAHTIRAFIVGFSAPLCAYLIMKIGNRWTMFIGSFLCVAALILIAGLPPSMLLWTFLWGIVMAFGLGTAGQVTVQNTLTVWFSKRRAFAISIVMLAGSLGGFVAQPLFAYMIKQTGKWEVGWLGAGLIAILAGIAVFFLKGSPSQYGQYIDGISPEEAKAAGPEKKKVARTYRADSAWTLSEAIRTKAFWFIALGYCTFSMSIYIVTAHGVLHMGDKGYPTMQAAWVISFFVMGGLVRPFVGYIGDIIEPRWLIALLLAGTAVSLGVFWKAPDVTSMAVATFVLGVCYGGGLILSPTTIGNYFSAPSFAKMNSVIYPLNLSLAAIVPAAAGYIFQFYKSYDLAFEILIGLSVVACLGALFFLAPPKKQ